MHIGTTLAFLTTCACILHLGAAAAADKVSEPPGAGNDGEIDRFIEQRMSETGIAGLGAAIIVHKKVVWMKGYGFADMARAVPFTPDTVMNIGSISKTFTGAALMHAVQEGKLSLDEDINTYLPFKVVNPHDPNGRITLRHLATHTSGITDRWAIYAGTYHYGDAPEPLDEFLKSYFIPGEAGYSKDNFLNVKPGTHREYSNIGARSRRLYRRARRRREAERLHQAPLLRPAADGQHRLVSVRDSAREAREAVRGAGRPHHPDPALRVDDLSGWRRPHLGFRPLQVLHRLVERRRVSGGTHPGEEISARRCSGSSTRNQTSRTM